MADRGNSPPKPSCIVLEAAWHGWWQQHSVQSHTWCVLCGFAHSTCNSMLRVNHKISLPLRLHVRFTLGVSLMLIVTYFILVSCILCVLCMLLVPCKLCVPHMLRMPRILSSNSFWWSDILSLIFHYFSFLLCPSLLTVLCNHAFTYKYIRLFSNNAFTGEKNKQEKCATLNYLLFFVKHDTGRQTKVAYN